MMTANNELNKAHYGITSALKYAPIGFCFVLVSKYCMNTFLSKDQNDKISDITKIMIENTPLTRIAAQVPVKEELLFRALLQNSISYGLYYGLNFSNSYVKIATISSAIIFGAYHYIGAKLAARKNPNLEPLMPLFAGQAISNISLGYFLGSVHNKAGIIGSIAAHAMNNLLFFGLAKLSNFNTKQSKATNLLAKIFN